MTFLVLGGSPCAGKSTIASHLAQQHALELYACDAFETPHVERSSLETQPTLHSARALDLGRHFMREPEDLLEFNLNFYREEWTLILEDLETLPTPLLLEGAACMPELVPLEWPAVWLVPSPEFQRHHYAQRPWIAGVLGGASNPAKAFDNWMARDELFAQHVIQQCQRLNRLFLVFDGSQTLEQNLEWVRTTLHLARVQSTESSSSDRKQKLEDTA